MTVHLIAVAQALIIYLFLSTSFYGWGRLASSIVRIAPSPAASLVHSIWLGWAFSLLIFQITHLFTPLTATVVIPITLVGVIRTIPHLPAGLRAFFQNNSRIFIIFSLTALLVVTVWIASRAMITVRHYDAGLYYYNLIRWINSFPIVPGLGILHGRLAYNQSFFTYVAALNFYPFFVHGNSFANSFLFLLTLVTLAKFLRPAIYRPSLLIDSHPFLYLPAIFALPIMVYLVFSEIGPVLPTPDLTSTLLQITMFVMLLRGLAVWKEKNPWMKGEVTVLAILVATAVTIKLSNLAFSAVIICFCLAYVGYSSKNSFRNLARILLPVMVILLVWGFQGYILSGAPLYPATVGYLPLKWAVPFASVVDEANWIYSWARQPNMHWKDVLGSWNWFRPWLSGIWRGNFHEVVFPLISAFILSGLAVLTSLVLHKKKYTLRYAEWTILIPLVTGLLYWFFTAPNPRFAGSLFWLLSLSSALLLILSLQPLLKKQAFAALLLLVFLVSNLNYAQFAFAHIDRFKNISLTGWQADITVPLVEKQTSTGLTVYTPETGNQCWESPIPCTPHFRASLRLIVPEDLGAGFYLEDNQ